MFTGHYREGVPRRSAEVTDGSTGIGERIAAPASGERRVGGGEARVQVFAVLPHGGRGVNRRTDNSATMRSKGNLSPK